jgi:DNA-binding transcriptional LysR family regulator
MNKLRAMQVFARIVEAGSLTGAAAALEVSGPSVVRSLAALERSLGVRQIDETQRVVCAAPAYLRRAGTPRSPADLGRHRCIVFSGLSPTNEWAFGGKPRLRASVRPVLRTNQVDAALDACIRGVGCGQFLGYQVESALREGRLRRVLTEFEPPPLPIRVVYPHARPSSNVRAFIELMVA